MNLMNIAVAAADDLEVGIADDADIHVLVAEDRMNHNVHYFHGIGNNFHHHRTKKAAADAVLVRKSH